FFAPGSTDSYPGHQYIVAGRSSDADGDQVADQPLYTAAPGHTYGGYADGCADAAPMALSPAPMTLSPLPAPSASPVLPPLIVVPALGPSASPWAIPTTRGFEGECYDWPTFADRLVVASFTHPSITWTHYATVTSAPSAFGGEQPFNGFVNYARWWNAQWPPAAQVLEDARHEHIRTFSWVKPPCVHASDHPGTGDGGPSWVQDVVNAIGSRKAQWDETAIFVIWDDWGGFYDHVTPPSPRAFDGLGPGLRTPFLIISPYVKPGTVATGVADYGSILRFTEQLFGIQSLHGIDDSSPDLTGFFDFSTTRPFVQVTASPTTTWQQACSATPMPQISSTPFRD
ncbi:MAG: hypothetical protein JO103_01870, partial [Candidatus Eremiobacteraeota bacterium]|nr:hypothetical protein [Candidatus Eremiobacteraeota bacterium]